jgi:hypothetical protein
VGAEAPAPPVVRHEVSASLDVPAHRIDVTDVIHVTAPPRGEPVRFLLNRNLEIRSVRLAPDDARVTWRAGDRWDPRHFWRRPPYGELDGFEPAREVQVEPPAAGWGGTVVTLQVEYGGVIADSLHAPERAYGRSFETTSGRIVAEGAYLTGGTFWVPWSGDGLFAFDLTVESPADWRVISQGDLDSERVDGPRRSTRWVCSAPSEEIYLIAGLYELRETPHGDVRIMAYTYADTGSEIVQPYLDAAGPVLDRYGELFGPYAYGKFALVENYWQTGYGMPSFTFLGSTVIRLPFIVYTSYPHEILHNWWGNGVYLRRGEGNWCEGLTAYGADYAAKERESAEAARDYRRSTLQAYRDFAQAGGQDFPLLGFRERDSAATQAVGYGKTLMVFHMLRRNLGDGSFYGALRRFWNANRFRRAGWDDLRTAFEDEIGGSSLVPFFDEWVKRPGAPVLRLADVSARDLGDGRFLVEGRILQDEPAFELSVPLVVEGEEEGARASADVQVLHTEWGFRVPVPFEPVRVALDPDFDVFRMLHAEEVPAALSGVLGAARVRVVIGAAADGALRDALRAAADDWARDSTVTVVEEPPGGPLAEFDGGTWLFGEGPAAAAARAELGDAGAAGGTLVAAVPGRFQRPTGLFLPESAEEVAAVARKVPHYSKYSWLRFDGARNTGKGFWEPGASPLTVELTR